MKCKICGYEVNQGVTSCPMCGSRLSEIKLDDNDFSWNTKDFPKPRELHDINMRWTMSELEPQQPKASMAEDASEGYVVIPDKTEVKEEKPAPDSSIGAWNMPLWYTQGTQGEGMRPFTASGYINIDSLKAPEVSPFPEMPKGYVPPKEDQTVPGASLAENEAPVDDAWFEKEIAEAHKNEKPEPFSTFVRKNEEFQTLLNKEYERANSLNNSEQAGEELRRTHADVFGHEDVIKAEELSAFEKMLLEGTEDGGSDKTLVLSRDKALGNQAEDPLDSMPKDTLSGTGSLSWSKMLDEMEAAKIEGKLKEKLPMAAPGLSAEAPKEPAEQKSSEGTVKLNKDTIEMKLAEMRAKDQEDKEKRSERRRKLDDMAKAREQFFFDMDEKTQPKESDVPIAEKLNEVFKEEDEKRAAEEAAAADKKTKKKKKSDDDDFMKPRKKHGFLVFLLILAILAGLVYGAYWGINKYAPDSIAADVANQIAAEAEVYWQKAVDKSNDVISFYTGEKKVQSNEKDQEFTTDNLTEEEISFEQLVKAADPDSTIKAVKNIKSLGYKPNTEYKILKLDEMELVEDERIRNEIYKTMIGYNASWVKFVNDGNADCMDYLKADGAAYRSAVSYELIGEITETFDELDLGEIRTNGSYYFVFAKEDVTIQQGDASSSVSTNLLYRLELVGSKYKIVDYSEF